MKRSVKVGRRFEGLDAEVLEATARVAKAKTANGLAWLFLSGFFIALSAASVIGVVDGTFNELNAVWIVAAPVLGAVITYYFGGRLVDSSE